MEKLNLKSIKNPPQEVIQAAENVFKTMAYVETVREIVRPYQFAILEKHQFKTAPEHVGRRGTEAKTITDPKDTYLLSDEDFQTYLKEVHAKHIENGFNVKFEYCPLLKAESLEVDAKKELIDRAEQLTGIKNNQVYSLKIRREYIELLLKICAPHIKA